MILTTYILEFINFTREYQMAITIKPQIIRKGTKDQSYRVHIPKAIIEANNWESKKFKLEVKNKKIVLTPV